MLPSCVASTSDGAYWVHSSICSWDDPSMSEHLFNANPVRLLRQSKLPSRFATLSSVKVSLDPIEAIFVLVAATKKLFELSSAS